MTHQRVPPPREADCLSRPYPSSQKGGTVIAEAVTDLATHLQVLADPDGYRPDRCPGCGFWMLHAHDYRTRVCQQPGTPEVTIRRYRCPVCTGCWQVLPAFIPRHLWYHWPLVEEGCGEVPSQPVPERAHRPSKWTRQRWLARLWSDALVLTQVLATSAEATLVAAAQAAGLVATRLEVVYALDRSFAEVAGLVHRLVPGIRLM